MLKFFYQSLNLFIFVWGSFCLNDFREALRCNALGDYTDTNIDINTFLLLSVVNCFVNLVNYDYNAFLLLLNNIMIIILAGFNINLYSTCENSCTDFYNGNRFDSYELFYSVLPYVQFSLSLVGWNLIFMGKDKFLTRDNGILVNDEEGRLIT